MLIHSASKSIVLKLREPGRVLGVVPTARQFEIDGTAMVAVPHRLEETRVLRNLGFDAPSPIAHHYEWPGQYKPFKAQAETAAFLTLNPRAFCLNGLGTGKTLATLWAFDYLRKLGEVHKMLVVSPLSTLERTWADETFRHFPHLKVGVLHGNKERRLKLLRENFDIYVINHDGVFTIKDQLAERTDIDLVVIDEVASFRNASTQRWKALHHVVKSRKWVWGLTGTPTPNEPTDAWAQVRLISPERVNRYFGQFKAAVMEQKGTFNWQVRESSAKLVHDAMQPAIRFTREQCVDLPPTLHQTREVEMTAEQKHAYKEMHAKLSMEFAGQQVLAANAAVKLGKLVQIACGIVYDQSGDEVLLPNKPRLDVIREVIEQAESKVIVFVPYKSVLNNVAESLAAFTTVARISGETSKTQRDRIFSDFQTAATPRVIVASPAAMSHGLTLTAASTIIWYAPITSNEVYEQANARIVRPGQKLSTLILNIEGSTVERKIYQRLRDKRKVQDSLLDLIAED